MSADCYSKDDGRIIFMFFRKFIKADKTLKENCFDLYKGKYAYGFCGDDDCSKCELKDTCMKLFGFEEPRVNHDAVELIKIEYPELLL